MIARYFATSKFLGFKQIAERLKRGIVDEVVRGTIVREIGVVPIYKNTCPRIIYAIEGLPVIHLCRTTPDSANYDFQIIARDEAGEDMVRETLSRLLNEPLVEVSQ